MIEERVSCVLNFAVEKLKTENRSVMSTLKDTSFLESLKHTNQPHIANFIQKDGMTESITDDVCPLDEHQRRSLHPCPNVTERSYLDARDPNLQNMLLGQGVISQSQQEYLTDSLHRTMSNERLLLILKRRSVADVKAFLSLSCLDGSR